MTLNAAINEAKLELISKAKKEGVHRGFGQTELGQLYDKYIDRMDYSDAMNDKRKALLAFKQWVENYTGR